MKWCINGGAGGADWLGGEASEEEVMVGMGAEEEQIYRIQWSRHLGQKADHRGGGKGRRQRGAAEGEQIESKSIGSPKTSFGAERGRGERQRGGRGRGAEEEGEGGPGQHYKS